MIDAGSEAGRRGEEWIARAARFALQQLMRAASAQAHSQSLHARELVAVEQPEEISSFEVREEDSASYGTFSFWSEDARDAFVAYATSRNVEVAPVPEQDRDGSFPVVIVERGDGKTIEALQNLVDHIEQTRAARGAVVEEANLEDARDDILGSALELSGDETKLGKVIKEAIDIHKSLTEGVAPEAGLTDPVR